MGAPRGRRPGAKLRLQDVIVEKYPVPGHYFEPVQTPIAAKRQMACSALPGHLGAVAALAVRAQQEHASQRALPAAVRGRATRGGAAVGAGHAPHGTHPQRPRNGLVGRIACVRASAPARHAHACVRLHVCA
jgi:hypothetical protein